jgi:hypothetical protein
MSPSNQRIEAGIIFWPEPGCWSDEVIFIDIFRIYTHPGILYSIFASGTAPRSA